VEPLSIVLIGTATLALVIVMFAITRPWGPAEIAETEPTPRSPQDPPKETDATDGGVAP
jgi:hypothetical protein